MKVKKYLSKHFSGIFFGIIALCTTMTLFKCMFDPCYFTKYKDVMSLFGSLSGGLLSFSVVFFKMEMDNNKKSREVENQNKFKALMLLTDISLQGFEIKKATEMFFMQTKKEKALHDVMNIKAQIFWKLEEVENFCGYYDVSMVDVTSIKKEIDYYNSYINDVVMELEDGEVGELQKQIYNKAMLECLEKIDKLVKNEQKKIKEKRI